MHNKMLLRAKQFNKQLVCCTLLNVVFSTLYDPCVYGVACWDLCGWLAISVAASFVLLAWNFWLKWRKKVPLRHTKDIDTIDTFVDKT